MFSTAIRLKESAAPALSVPSCLKVRGFSLVGAEGGEISEEARRGPHEGRPNGNFCVKKSKRGQ